jgi:2-polyprenyl-3-methyl-5-hydroxy-6-metoxy-1,4-benzoquinol methylase
MKKIKCPYCRFLGRYYFTLNHIFYYRCKNCYLIYKINSKNYEEVLESYKNAYFDSYASSEIYGERDKIYKDILNTIEKKCKIGKILDVGTGCGFFLKIAKERGWIVKGIDPSVKSVEIAQQKNCLSVYRGTIKEYIEKDQFDVITFINALDHSAQPWNEIERSKYLLKSGGLIFIRFPNGLLHSNLYNIFSRTKSIKMIQKLLVFHEFSFTSKFIRKLLSDKGLSNILILNSPSSIDSLLNPASIKTSTGLVHSIIYLFAKATQFITSHNLLIGTSLLAIAKKD